MEYYDETSRGYDELHRDEQLRKAMIIAEHVHPKKDELLLDVGCGPAPYFSMFDCAKAGIDPSLELLKLAMETEEGFFVQARGEALPFMDRSFDYVISVTAVHNFDDVEKGISEMGRVTKPKGRIVISVLRRSPKFERIEKLIGKKFKVKKIILEDKDAVFVAEPRR